MKFKKKRNNYFIHLQSYKISAIIYFHKKYISSLIKIDWLWLDQELPCPNGVVSKIYKQDIPGWEGRVGDTTFISCILFKFCLHMKKKKGPDEI